MNELKIKRDSLIKQIVNFTDQRKFDSADLYCNKLSEFSFEKGQIDSLEYGKVILYKGRTKFFKKELIDAEKELLQAKDILSRYFEIDKKYYTISVGCLASCYQQSGQYFRALDLYNEAIILYNNYFGGESDPDYAIAVNGLGIINRKLGNLEKSIELLQKSVKLREKKFGMNSKQVSLAINSLGITYREKGDYKMAEECFIKASEIAHALEGNKGENYLRSQLGMAALYKNLGNYKASTNILEKIIDLGEVGDKLFLSNVASAYALLGSVARNQSDHSLAEIYYLKCLDLNNKIQNNNQSELQEVLMNLATIYSLKKEYVEADSIYTLMSNVIPGIYGTAHFEWATLCHNWGCHYLRKGDFKNADSLCKIAYHIRLKLFTPHHFELLNSLNVLIKINFNLGKWDEVINYSNLLDQGCKELIFNSLVYMSESELSSLFNRIIPIYNTIYSVMFQNKLLTEKLSEICFNFSLLSKALILNQRKFINSCNNDFSKLKEKAINRQYLENELIELFRKKQSISVNTQIDNIAVQINLLEKDISRILYESSKYYSPPNYKSISTGLNYDELGLEFFIFIDLFSDTIPIKKYGAFIIKKNEMTPKVIDICNSDDLINLIQTYSALGSNEGINKLYSLAKVQPNSQNIFEMLWEKLIPYLGQSRIVYFSPIGQMNSLNHYAILHSKLRENTRLVQLYSFADNNWTKSEIKIDRNKINALVVGGINYNSVMSTSLNSEELVNSRTNSYENTNEIFSNQSNGFKWTYLEGSKKEVHKINQILNFYNFKPKLLMEDEASELIVKNLLRKENSILIFHIATHGFYNNSSQSRELNDFDETDNASIDIHSLLQSGLIMAGANNSKFKSSDSQTEHEDCILTSLEISQFNMRNTELVILSACETGLGDIDEREGVIGLQRSFKMAGAKYIIMSLWKIQDQASSEFMIKFYSLWLKGKKTIDIAFKEAQLWMKDRYVNSSNWASFILIK